MLACATFAEARAQLATRRVAALLTDIRLAEFNGLHLVQLARSLHPRARLVVFSGYSDDVLQAEAERVGAPWLLKPMDLEALREHLADLPAPRGESSARQHRLKTLTRTAFAAARPSTWRAVTRSRGMSGLATC